MASTWHDCCDLFFLLLWPLRAYEVVGNASGVLKEKTFPGAKARVRWNSVQDDALLRVRPTLEHSQQVGICSLLSLRADFVHVFYNEYLVC